MQNRKYLSKRHTAERLDVSVRTIDRLRVAGQLDATTLSVGVRITIASIESYERCHRRPSGTNPFPVPGRDAERAKKSALRATTLANEEKAA